MSEQQPSTIPEVPIVPPGFAASGQGQLIADLVAVVAALRAEVTRLRADVAALTAP